MNAAAGQASTSPDERASATRAPSVGPRPDHEGSSFWLIGGIWLIFLGYPLASVVFGDRPGPVKVLGVAMMLIFAATHVLGLRRASKYDYPSTVQWRALISLLVMVLMIAGVSGVIGLNALAMLPYLVPLALLTQPLWFAGAVFVGTMVTAIAVPALSREPAALQYAAIVLVVAVLVGVVRMHDQRTDERRVHAEEIALAAERDRMARDVHDVLGHSLTVVTVKAELAQRLVSTDPQRAQAEMAEVQQLARRALAEIRSTISGLRTATLADEIASARSALTGAGMAVDLPTDLTVLDPRHRITVSWALREAVTNVVRHSRATHCTVRLGSNWLTVHDDGVGTGKLREGNGLRGLRERVEAAGGTVQIAAGPGGLGTELRVQLL